MNAATASTASLPMPLRSEAFVEDILEFVEPAPEWSQRPIGWLMIATPLAVALLGVAFALVPPLA